MGARWNRPNAHEPAIKISETGRARLAACLIEDQILARLRVHRKQTFLAIADSLPEYDWRSLLMALNRLRERGRVQLSALRWDYEVVLLESSRSPRRHPLDEQART
ncbi:MAG TPA: hypothetical protein VJ692_08255 [Nitrospiraceae bacterium]|nr:hypothetical protein [Nitrospiraceae bacterium]